MILKWKHIKAYQITIIPLIIARHSIRYDFSFWCYNFRQQLFVRSLIVTIQTKIYDI